MCMEQILNQTAIPSKLLILIALLQGLALLGLHQTIELDIWPYHHPDLLFALYALVIGGPLVLLLGLNDTNLKPLFAWTGAYSLILAGLGFYVGRQAQPIADVDEQVLLPGLAITLAIASFKTLMYLQQGLAQGSFRHLQYPALFLHSWRNFLTLGLALGFTLSVWLVLMLWAALFDAVGIKFFEALFTSHWFYYPILAMALGLGISLLRRQSAIIDTIVHIQQLLVKWLLVMLVLVSALFLVTLPFTGLEPLWQSGGSTLILWMLALMLFFVNSVYQAQTEATVYPRWLHRLIYSGLALMPLYSLVSAYGLYLRVEQYGWSVSRCWAVLIWLLLSLFSLGYFWQILRRRDHWLIGLCKVNVPMGKIVLLAMLLVNSPLLNFLQISADSQMARLEQGKVTISDFDFSYFRHQLAGPGYQALQQIKADYADSHPEVVVRIDALYQLHQDETAVPSAVQLSQVIKGVENTVPEALMTAIVAHLQADTWRLAQNSGYYLKTLDLDGDGQQDYLLIEENDYSPAFTLFYFDQGGWLKHPLDWHNRHQQSSGQDLIEAIKASDFELILPRWKQIRVKDLTLYSTPE